jgi:hypothetical protein
MRKMMLLHILFFLLVGNLSAQDNRVVKKERREGWELLFDGQSTKGWHTWKRTDVSKGWGVKDHALHLDPSVKDDRGDLVTDASFENYELRFTWKIAPKGNSGIIFLVQEKPGIDATWFSGPEYQLIDNVNYPDKLDPKQMSASLYDLIACPAELCKPAGQWNEGAIIVDHGRIRQELNGKTVVDVTLGSATWNAALAPSKFAPMKDFAKVAEGRIAIQDHSGEVWVKNIKIRKL